MQGIVYTETVIHVAPEAFVAEAPYQMVIVEYSDSGRVTGRVSGERVMIGDPVRELEPRGGVRYFEKAT